MVDMRRPADMEMVFSVKGTDEEDDLVSSDSEDCIEESGAHMVNILDQLLLVNGNELKIGGGQEEEFFCNPQRTRI